MRRAANLHSRVVAWLKVILPLSALASLSMLFLLARTINPEDAIPYAQVDVAERVREPRLTSPTWSGMTSDGTAVTIEADEARPGVAGTGNAGLATAVRAHLESATGGATDLTAATGRIDDSARKIILSGDVIITTSSGYRAEMPEVASAMDETDITSSGGEVVATGPLGRLRADQMRLRQGETGYLMDFNGGVRLVYQPAN